MKVSSLSGEIIEPSLALHHTAEPAVSTVKQKVSMLLQQLDRMGSAIAVGEAGDLDGAHQLRQKHAEV